MKKQFATAMYLSALLLAVALAAPAELEARALAGYVDYEVEELNIPRPYVAGGVDGSVVWQREIRRAGATFLRIHFSGFDLGEGDFVTISDPTESVAHRYEGRGPRDGSDFWSFSVPGDVAVVTLHAQRGGEGFAIDQIGVGVPVATPETICGSDGRDDVACFGAGPDRTSPVARLLFQDGPFFFFCTGWLVDGSNSSTLMTNEHCISNQATVDTLEATFGFEAVSCGSFSNHPGTTFDGGTFLGDEPSLDYALMTLSGNPEATFGELTATTSSPSSGDRIVMAQHGGGNPKTVCVHEDSGNNNVSNINSTRITLSGYDANSQFSYECDTEGGSSGSPVFGRDQSNEIIGLHHLGGLGFPCRNYSTHMDDICDDAGSLLNCS